MKPTPADARLTLTSVTVSTGHAVQTCHQHCHGCGKGIPPPASESLEEFIEAIEIYFSLDPGPKELS